MNDVYNQRADISSRQHRKIVKRRFRFLAGANFNQIHSATARMDSYSKKARPKFAKSRRTRFLCLVLTFGIHRGRDPEDQARGFIALRRLREMEDTVWIRECHLSNKCLQILGRKIG